MYDWGPREHKADEMVQQAHSEYIGSLAPSTLASLLEFCMEEIIVRSTAALLATCS